MKTLIVLELEDVVGGAKCQCVAHAVPDGSYQMTDAQYDRAERSYIVKGKSTKTECRQRCCEEDGCDAFRYGASTKYNYC